MKIISDGVIYSEDGFNAIVEEFYKRDTLSVINEVYVDFKQLFSFLRGENETFEKYEVCFSDQVSNMNGKFFLIVPMLSRVIQSTILVTMKNLPCSCQKEVRIVKN